MRKGKITLLVVALITAFVATGLLLLGPARAGDLEPPAGPDDPASAMYTIEDIYHYLDTGVKGTKRTGGFVEPTLPPGPTGHTLNQVHDKIGERCITCEGTLIGTRWCDNGNGTVTDMTTGLVWLQKADWGGTKPWRSSTSYDDAHTRAGLLKAGSANANLSDGSTEGDWRLPTKNELYKLAIGTDAVGSGNMQAFTGVQFFASYWSGSTYEASTDAAWHVIMSFGFASFSVKTLNFYVWPVRGGN
jgi:hypothetical protein